jgi:hypothetical protein
MTNFKYYLLNYIFIHFNIILTIMDLKNDNFYYITFFNSLFIIMAMNIDMIILYSLIFNLIIKNKYTLII